MKSLRIVAVSIMALLFGLTALFRPSSTAKRLRQSCASQERLLQRS